MAAGATPNEMKNYGGTFHMPLSSKLAMRVKADHRIETQGLEMSAQEIDIDYKLNDRWGLSAGLREDSRITPRSDVYSLASVLYEMLAGTPAIRGNNTFEIVHKIANEPFAPPSSLNPEIEEALDEGVISSCGYGPNAVLVEDGKVVRMVLSEYLGCKVVWDW